MELLKDRDAAKFLNRSVRTIRGWRLRGTGPKYIVDPMGSIHYDPEELHRWLLSGPKRECCNNKNEV
jgi:hypothetical protein